MKKLLLIPILLLGLFAKAQLVPTALVTLSTVTDLRSQTPQSLERIDLLGLTTVNDGNGGMYSWDALSTNSDDGFITIQVTGITTGRWVRIGNGNTIKGNITTSGLALTTAYTVSYPGGALPFVPITVVIIPRTAAAAGPSYISSITNTGFTVNFITIPLIGSLNINFDFVVIKQ